MGARRRGWRVGQLSNLNSRQKAFKVVDDLGQLALLLGVGVLQPTATTKNHRNGHTPLCMYVAHA